MAPQTCICGASWTAAESLPCPECGSKEREDRLLTIAKVIDPQAFKTAYRRSNVTEDAWLAGKRARIASAIGRAARILDLVQAELAALRLALQPFADIDPPKRNGFTPYTREHILAARELLGPGDAPRDIDLCDDHPDRDPDFIPCVHCSGGNNCRDVGACRPSGGV